MSEFLTGKELSERIRRVARGANACCAVAFWGKGSDDLFEPSRGTRIICDISMGGTSAKALKALGAPANRLLKFQNAFHAKVYLSDEGAVVGSANASDNGIGLLKQKAGLIEAGTFHEYGSQAWKAALVWFNAQHAAAKQVDDEALERALRLYRPYIVPSPVLDVRESSILDLVRVRPDLFDGYGFAFSKVQNKSEVAKEARKKANKASESNQFDDWPMGDMFLNWEEEDVENWPGQVYSFHLGARGRLYINRFRHIFSHGRTVFAKRSGRSKTIPGVSLIVAEEIDRDLAEQILADGSVLYPTANDLQTRLLELSKGRAKRR